VTGDLRRWGGLARSLVIYRARPWKITRLARLYGSFLAPGDLAFDIGAHAGNRTRALLRAGARVVALEPQRIFHDFLARDLPREVTLLPLAAGAVPGTAELAVSRLHPTVSSLASGFPARMRAAPGFAGVRWDTTETVEVTTLDALIAAHGLPRFIKIDVEGAEAEVLAGLGQPVDWLAFEVLAAAPEAADACLTRLAGLGAYAFNLVPGEAAAFALDRWLDADAMARELRRRAGDGRAGDVYARRQGGGGA
jgi:FkbM family methyltransferase